MARQRAGGRKGAFPESCIRTLEGKHYGPHHASGEWREIADRVCTSISELAALRGRPEFGDAVYPYSETGKTFIPVIYQRARRRRSRKRASKVKAKLAQLDPWDPDYWATKEEATLSEMRYRFAPQEVVNLQMRQMVYLGKNQWEFKEDADPKFIDQVSGEEQKARLAALRGRPSGSDPEQSSTMMRDEVLERRHSPRSL